MRSMKTRMRVLTVGGLVAFTVTAFALPGEPPSVPDAKENATEQNKPPLLDKTSEPAAAMTQIEAYRTSELFGKTVRGSDNSKLGEFQNWLIDLPQGRIVVGLVGSGGILSIGETVRAIPPTTFHYNETEGTLTLNTDKRTFHQAPAFNARQLDDVGQVVAAYRQFGQEPYWQVDSTRQLVREGDKSAEQPTRSTAPSNLEKASQIIGRTVHDGSQQELGEVRDFVLDLKSGRILYAVLAQGGILGVGDKLYPIPPQAFTVSDKGLALNTTREQLERAPQFTRESWPSVNDLKWASDVYTYYHAPMYWLSGHSEMNRMAPDLMRQPVRQAEGKDAKLEPAPAAAPLKGKILEALKANDALALLADRIQITEDGGHVILKGEVDTQEQKESIVKTVKDTAGVAQVEDRITVRK